MNTKKCTNCGVDIPVEAAFCNFCGAAQQSQQAPPQPEQAAPNYQHRCPHSRLTVRRQTSLRICPRSRLTASRRMSKKASWQPVC